MEKSRVQDIETAAEAFIAELREIAGEHVDAGPGQSPLGGALYVIAEWVKAHVQAYAADARIILSGKGEYARPTGAPRLPAAATAAAAAKRTMVERAYIQECRPKEHDFRGPHGEDADKCLKCNKPKSTRGRKRIQQVIPAAAAGGDDDRCTVPGCRNLVPSPGLPYCETHRKERTETKRRLPKCEVQSCRNFAVVGSEYCDAHKPAEVSS